MTNNAVQQLFGEWRKSVEGCRGKRRLGAVETENPATRYSSDDLVSFPARRLLMREVFAWVWLRQVLVLACVGVGVFFLVEVAECMVHLPMLALICSNWRTVSCYHKERGSQGVLTVQE